MSETPVETIRRAAAKMRERAEAVDERDYERVTRKVGRLTSNGQHVASWQPTVAVAVADWLDDTAEFFNPNSAIWGRALTVARTYLGEAS